MLSNPETYDHIITDIPYGISIDRLDQHIGISDIEIIKAEHTVAGNEELFRQFFPAAFCTLKPNSFLITWCDAMQWQNMYNLACEAGFKVQRWPFVWAKDYPCLNQKAQFNFTKSTEFAMVCRKGTITLPEKQTNNYIIASRDQLVEDCQHPFAKPFAIWERLFKAVTMENQKILDPFCGKGSSFISGLKLGRNMYGVEKDEALYNGGLEVLKSYYLKLNAKSVFK
jgi:DNA modification methylase